MPAIEQLVCPVVSPDDVTEFTCESAGRANITHKQSLRAYRGNGRCSCEFFTLSPRGRTCPEELLRKGYTAERAVIEGQIKLKDGQHIADALRCKHIVEARRAFCDIMVNALDQAKKTHEGPNPF